MPLLKLPESFGNYVPAVVRVLRAPLMRTNSIILQLETECGFAEVEVTSEEMFQVIRMFNEVLEDIENDSLQHVR
jgi:uncharacterized protein YqgV (UPF0045/DUF77 family)